MSKATLYTGLKADLATVSIIDTAGNTLTFQEISLWRNQQVNEAIEIPFNYPACFIEFLPSDYMELSSGAQSFDLTVRLHICFKSFKTEDVDILKLCDAVYAKIQLKQYSTYGKMKRRSETQDFDHNQVQDYQQDYWIGKANDFGAVSTTTAVLNDSNITKT